MESTGGLLLGLVFLESTDCVTTGGFFPFSLTRVAMSLKTESLYDSVLFSLEFFFLPLAFFTFYFLKPLSLKEQRAESRKKQRHFSVQSAPGLVSEGKPRDFPIEE